MTERTGIECLWFRVHHSTRNTRSANKLPGFARTLSLAAKYSITSINQTVTGLWNYCVVLSVDGSISACSVPLIAGSQTVDVFIGSHMLSCRASVPFCG